MSKNSVVITSNESKKTRNSAKECKTRGTANILVEIWNNDEKITIAECKSVSAMWKTANKFFDEYPDSRQLIYFDGELKYDLHCETVGGRRWKRNAIEETRRKHPKKEEAVVESVEETKIESIAE